MCLAVPGKITHIIDDEPLTRRGKVNFSGITREVNLSFVPEAGIDDYVMVHVGFAISRVDENEALKVFEYLKQMDDLDELKDDQK